MTHTFAFISYVRENIDIIDHLAHDLRSFGIKVWLDRNDIMPGQWWKLAISEAIQRGAFFIACFSRELNMREETYMHGELRLALDRLRNMPKSRIWFIPVMLNDTDLPSHEISDRETLRDLNVVKLFLNWDDGIAQILRAMKMDDQVHRRILHLVELIQYHPTEQLYAIEQVARLGAAAVQAVPELIKVVRSTDGEVRAHAVDALGMIGPAARGAIPILIESVRHGDPELRRRASSALGRIGSEAAEVICQLAESLRDCIWTVRNAAANSLEMIGPAAIPTLIGALKDDDADVRKRASDVLGNIGQASLPAVSVLAGCLREDSSQEVRQSAGFALGKIGPFAIPALTSALKDSDKSVRKRATEVIGEIGLASADAISLLINALSDADWTVRGQAAKCLGRLGKEAARAAPVLADALHDDDKDVRERAADALGQMGPDAAPFLIKALNDPNTQLRKLAADALGIIGKSYAETVPALIIALRDPNSAVRHCVAKSLTLIGSAAVPALVDTLKDPEPDVRRRVCAALGDIQNLPDVALVALGARLWDEDWHVQFASAVSLGKIGSVPKSAIARLETLSMRGEKRVKWAARQALASIDRVIL